MQINYEYLKDNTFLKELANQHIKEFFAKIVVLDWQKEETIEQIQSRVMSASINIDGNSSIRRTANISVLMDNLIYNITNVNNLLSINKKINLQIGYVNTTNKYTKYPILWFPLGVYVIISCNVSNSESGIVANIQLKDKMCLLNGECGGTIPASAVFDNYQTIDENGEWVVLRPPIYQIIKQLVNHFGGQQLGRIIIADLDTQVKQIMKWTFSSPLYFLRKDGQYHMTTSGANYKKYIEDGWEDIEGSPFSYGEDVGFIFTDFTFPGDLVGDAGTTVVNILDSIREVLGNYEYFYDIDGNFVFQQIKNYLNNSQSEYIIRNLKKQSQTANSSSTTPDYVNTATTSAELAYLIDTSNGKSVFSFDDDTLISSYSNNPQYNNIKNDFVVWGIKTLTNGFEIPIRYHLAIDKKPTVGNTYMAIEYQDPEDEIKKWQVPLSFSSRSKFPSTGVVGMFYLATNENNAIYVWKANDTAYGYQKTNLQLEEITTTDWRTQLYFQGVMAEPLGVSSNYYYTELANEWPKIYDIRAGKFKDQVENNPSGVTYFLDFIDVNSGMKQFSVNNIGRRSLVLNENKNVNCIFEPSVPDVVFINRDYDSGQDSPKTAPAKMRKICRQRGQYFYQVPGEIYNALQAGGTLYSAYQVIRQLLHQYTSYNESITIQTVPLYHLQPNTRITVKDEKSNIFGDYMITTMSFNIDTNSQLTINAIRALQKI